MEFVKHRHPLVLNEFYHGGEGDACYLCKEPLRSPFAHSVYLCTQGERSSVIPDDDDDDNDEDDDDAVDFDCDKMLVHKSCAESPLVLTDSYMHPQHPITLKTESPVTCSICYEHSVCKYLNFDHKCKICKDYIKPTLWLYYCAGCRIFVHIHCANAPPETKTRALGEFGDLVHLPTQDESSVNMFRQLLIHQMMINQGQGDALTWSFSSISTITAADVAGPYKEVIHHWSHDQHPLNLVNKCSTPKIHLVALTDNGKDSDDDSTVIVCDGCTYPINSSNTSYYECHPCNYFLHRYCAELPKLMLPYKFQPYNRYSDRQIIFTEICSSYLFQCNGCKSLKSGIHIATDNGSCRLDIGCALLPEKIKHEAHEHPLTQAVHGDYNHVYEHCDACGLYFGREELVFGCSGCFFNIHTRCALRPHKLKHRWDPHPLTLLTPEIIIENHPHDFNCEHCSADIDTTRYWFYHCSVCDLSCHIDCINKFYRYSNINFSASKIKIEQDELHQKLHDHGLTLVLNKRKRCCGSCCRQLFYDPILQCTTCNFIICLYCVDAD
ncbi:hypothetical protein POM88_047935 [Heracleum sosnowskyi]|uniref:DC1 domain-containing protein n=1 Tax=Heracleum sosnowskyi TaxID=360622 RepID=A0AAD8M014_9APIA|nr:hypothetical protein POM88_047935 [Heracleum sosnowskyi]